MAPIRRAPLACLVLTTLVACLDCTSVPSVPSGVGVPVIDISPLLTDADGADATARREEIVAAIGDACVERGFFQVVNHGVSEQLQRRLESSFAAFVAQPREVKRRIEMARAGSSWRGYFEVGEEFTKGVVDEKEGLYFAAETPGDDRPLHGSNLWPEDDVAPGLRDAVLDYMLALSQLSRTLLHAIGDAIGLPRHSLAEQFEPDATTLFRCFHYPPHDPAWGADSLAVGEHTDMGFLTILKQDCSGGLQARCRPEDGNEWVDVPPVPGAFVVNLGDCLERSTGGLLRATPHRVLQRRDARRGRFSFPFFFDPRFDAHMRSLVQSLPPELQQKAAERRRSAPERWDGRDLSAYEGTAYGEFVVSKVSLVFPELARTSGVREPASADRVT